MRVRLQPVDVDTARAVLAGDLDSISGDAYGWRPGRGWPHADTAEVLHATATGEVPAPDAWLVVLAGTGEVVGECGWKGGPGPDGVAEMAYALAPAYRGLGLGTAAVAEMRDWALAQPRCTALRAEVHASNTPSRRVLERLGFTVTATGDAYVTYEISAACR